MLAGVAHRRASAPSTGACCRPASRLDHPLRAVLSAAAAILRRRLPQRRGEIDADGRPPCRPATAPDAVRDVADGARGGQHRHRVEGAEQRRHPAPGDARPASCASPRELGFRPNDLAQSLHPRPDASPSASSPTTASAASPCRSWRRSRSELADRRHRASSCATPPTIPARERQHHRAAAGQARRRPDRHRAARRPPPADRRPARATCRCIYVFSQADDPTRFCLCPTTRAARARRPSTRRRSAAGASPTSPAPSASRPSACAATAIAPRSPPPASPSTAATTCSGAWSEAWGREAVAPALRDAARPPRRASSAATTRSPAASLDGAARTRHRACPRTSPSSASTTGT